MVVYGCMGRGAGERKRALFTPSARVYSTVDRYDKLLLTRLRYSRVPLVVSFTDRVSPAPRARVVLLHQPSRVGVES